jgi:hypothetical protein
VRLDTVLRIAKKREPIDDLIDAHAWMRRKHMADLADDPNSVAPGSSSAPEQHQTSASRAVDRPPPSIE